MSLSLLYQSTSNDWSIHADSTMACSSFSYCYFPHWTLIRVGSSFPNLRCPEKHAPMTPSYPNLFEYPEKKWPIQGGFNLRCLLRSFLAHVNLILYPTTPSHMGSFLYPHLTACPDALNLLIYYIHLSSSIDGRTILPPSCQSRHAKTSIVPLFDPFTHFSANVVSLRMWRPLMIRQRLAFNPLIQVSRAPSRLHVPL